MSSYSVNPFHVFRPPPILSHRKMPHSAQIPRAQAQSRLDPQIGDVDQFLPSDRIYDLPGLDDGLPRRTGALALTNKIVNGSYAIAVFGDSVDDPDFMKFLRTIDASAQDHSLSPRGIEPARQKTVCAHAGEEIEKNLRQAELSAFLGDDDVVGQRRLESPAERITLNQGNRTNGQVVIDRPPILLVDACVGISPQAVPVFLFDELHEKRKVAAQIEYAGNMRAEDKVRDPQAGARIRRRLFLPDRAWR